MSFLPTHASLESTATDLPQIHSGEFFEIDQPTLLNLKRAGYQKIGVGLVLLNPAGQVLIAEHKANHKLPDHIRGVTSETLGGNLEKGQVVAERIIQAIGRCIMDELALDLSAIQLSSRHDQHYALGDWPVSARNGQGKLLGINVPLVMDEPTALKAGSVRDTKELYTADFVDPRHILAGSMTYIRPGTQDCLRGLDDLGLLDPANLTEARIVFPDCPEPSFDIDLARI